MKSWLVNENGFQFSWLMKSSRNITGKYNPLTQSLYHCSCRYSKTSITIRFGSIPKNVTILVLTGTGRRVDPSNDSCLLFMKCIQCIYRYWERLLGHYQCWKQARLRESWLREGFQCMVYCKLVDLPGSICCFFKNEEPWSLHALRTFRTFPQSRNSHGTITDVIQYAVI